MLQSLRSRARDERGFTLIELLVVILIIGILAAIAIPSFLNQRDKANDASAKADARTAQTAAETYLTDSATQNYASISKTALKDIEETLPAAADTSWDVQPVSSGAGYYVEFTSDPTGNTFRITRGADGTVARTCVVADADNKGGCQDVTGTSGSW